MSYVQEVESFRLSDVSHVAVSRKGGIKIIPCFGAWSTGLKDSTTLLKRKMESERLGCRRRGHDWLTLAWNPKTIGLSISRSRVIFVYLCVCVCPFGTLFVKRVTIAKFLKTLGCFRHCAKYSFNPINNPMRLWGSNLYFTDEEIEAQQDCNEPPCHHIAVRWKRLFTWVYQPSFVYSTLNYYTSLMDSSCCSK